MGVSRDEVLRVAELARLRLTPEEVELFTEQLNTILGHVEDLRALEAEAPDGDAGAGEPERGIAPLRPDAGPPDALVRSPAGFAPEWKDGLFTAPRIPGVDADG